MNKKLSRAYIALGSNLEQPVLQVLQAFEALERLPNSRLINRSSLYRSAPMGRLDQPDFINAVARLDTALTPHELLRSLLEIEFRQGRVREAPNAPRTLDLDVLLYDDLQIHDEKLTIPHPRMTQRAFVLQPLMEIDPACQIPGADSIVSLLILCRDQKLEKIESALF